MDVTNYDWWNRPPKKQYIPEDQEILVEQAHVPTQTLIKQFREAGVRLQDYRKEQYDFGEGEPIPAGASDPTRAPNFDIADASRIAETAEANIEEVKRKNAQTKKERKMAEETETAIIKAAETAEKEKKETERPVT